MRIVIKTKVAQDYRQVFAGFNEELFLALVPPLTPLKLLRFDGCKLGDEVRLRVYFMDWFSEITAQGEREREIFFIDEGTRLPFTFSYWKHHHQMISLVDGGCEIVDDIQYESPLFLGPLLYPLLYFQFWYRKRIYKRYFGA